MSKKDWLYRLLEITAGKFRAKKIKKLKKMFLLVVSVLTFYSDNPSSNPAGYKTFLYEIK